MNYVLVSSISRFINAQLPLLLSVRLFILNVPLPLLQNDPAGLPNGKYDPTPAFTVDPTEYLLTELVFG